MEKNILVKITKKLHHISSVPGILLPILFSFLDVQAQDTPIVIAKRVAEKVLNETSFNYFFYEQVGSPTIQTIDFRRSSYQKDASFYAYSLLTVPREKQAIFGISSGSPIKIWINDILVYQNESAGNPEFEEIAYGIYKFTDTFRIHLNKTSNRLLIKTISGEKAKINMGAIHEDGLIDREVAFGLESMFNDKISGKYLFIGPFNNSTEANPLNNSFPPESGFKFFYTLNDENYSWRFAEKNVLLDLQIPDNATFRSHPYSEWNYANGVTMWSLLMLSDATGDLKYQKFVKQFCDLTLNDYQLFEHQYFGLNEYNGHNSRIFRMHMLDDASGPALPFIFLYEKGYLDKAWFLIEKAAEYSSHGQFRLDDNTLCRPEPTQWTIWADDLFMYLPFILKYSDLTGNKSLKEDAVLQAKMFYKYLFDKEKDLYYHGWNSVTGKHIGANWSRANGWVAWAMSGLLQNIPENSQQYRELKKIHKEHLDGLLKYQDKSGLWHQVLDHPETYLETSGTALFIIALARGVKEGWLGEKYKLAAIKAWRGLQSQIDADGTVHGICQGTSIGENIKFYQERKTISHDPRGIGAVITAGIEMEALFNK